MVADHGLILAERTSILAAHDQKIVFRDQILLDQKEILRQLGQIEVDQHQSLRSTHGIATVRYMRWHNWRVDAVNVERRHRQGFFSTHHFLNPKDEKDSEE